MRGIYQVDAFVYGTLTAGYIGKWRRFSGDQGSRPGRSGGGGDDGVGQPDAVALAIIPPPGPPWRATGSVTGSISNVLMNHVQDFSFLAFSDAGVEFGHGDGRQGQKI